MSIFPNLVIGRTPSQIWLELKILLSYLHLLSSNCLGCEFSSKVNEALILKPIYPNLYFKHLILKY